MKSKTPTLVGALHPILFFAGIYVVVLLFSIFICSTIFYSCNVNKNTLVEKKGNPIPAERNNITASIATVK